MRLTCPKCKTKLGELAITGRIPTLTPYSYCLKCDDIYIIKLELWERLKRLEKKPKVKKWKDAKYVGLKEVWVHQPNRHQNITGKTLRFSEK